MAQNPGITVFLIIITSKASSVMFWGWCLLHGGRLFEGSAGLINPMSWKGTDMGGDLFEGALNRGFSIYENNIIFDPAMT